MWEIIEENRKKSLVIFFAMGICLLTLGYVLGHAFWELYAADLMRNRKITEWLGIRYHDKLAQQAGLIGLSVSYVIWIGWSLFSYFFGDRFILLANNAQLADKNIYPQLYNIADEISIAANLNIVPRLHIIYSPVPNAFATGRGPENSAIAVTSGLLNNLNRDELQGVIAHEMSHIINRDALLLTFAGVMVGSVQLIADIFLRSSRFAKSGCNTKAPGSRIAVAVALLFAVLTPIIMTAMYFAISRKREYLADASAVRLTRYPEGLASALEKISTYTAGILPVSKLAASMYISNPLKDGDRDWIDWRDTHPPISARIRILREMAGNVNYAEYQTAFSRVNSGQVLALSGNNIPDADKIPIREGHADTRPEHTSHEDITATYASGISIGQKAVVPNYNIPAEETAASVNHFGAQPILQGSGSRDISYGSGISTGQRATESVPDTDRPPQEFILTRKAWDILPCLACGATKEISPGFSAPFFVCHRCGRKIYVKYLLEGQ
jgi:heat shock protein HtpX